MTTEKENKPNRLPVDYTREKIGSTICDRLFAGESLFEICRDAAMPDKPTVMRWLAQYPKFLDEYVFTCQLLTEDLAAQAVSRSARRRRRRRATPLRPETVIHNLSPANPKGSINE
jgi:hypothetical protein